MHWGLGWRGPEGGEHRRSKDRTARRLSGREVGPRPWQDALQGADTVAAPEYGDRGHSSYKHLRAAMRVREQPGPTDPRGWLSSGRPARWDSSTQQGRAEGARSSGQRGPARSTQPGPEPQARPAHLG